MANLFRAWPKDRIAQIFLSLSEPDTVICPISWRVGYEDLAIFSPIKARLRKERLARRKSRAESKSVLSLAERKWQRAYRALEGYLRRGLDFSLECMNFSLDKSILRALDELRPQVMYSVLGTPRLINLASSLSKRYQIPLVPHIMDDWPANFNRTKPTNRILQAFINMKVPEVFRKAPFRFAIGPELSNLLGSRYGVHFEPLMNCVNFDRRQPYDRLPNTGIVNFAYVGGLHSNRMVYFNDIGSALMRLRSRDVHGNIIIYRQNQDLRHGFHLAHPEVMRYATPDEEALLESSSAKIDAFIHVDTFDSAYVDYFRHSLSAKLPWCMAGGVPFLAYGPQDNATMRYIGAQGVGIAVTKRIPIHIENALTALIVDSAMRVAMGKKARQVTLKKHSDKREQDTLRRGLYYATTSYQSG